MRNYEMKKRQVEEKILVETSCDLCGTVAKQGHWNSSTYEVAETEIEVTVKQKDGESFPEGGYGTQYVVDMCPSCFKDKLIPWLKSEGYTTERTDWDW